MARYRFLSFASIGVLAACASGAGLPHPDITFDHLQPMPVSVAQVETEVLGGSEADGFAVSPSEAAERYLSTRFNAVGGNGTLRAVMEEATVRHVYSPSKGRMTGYLNVAGHDVYDVKLILRLEHISESGVVLYGNTLKAQRTMNITEHASVAEREQHQLEGIEQLYADLDRQVVRVVLTDMRLNTQ